MKLYTLLFGMLNYYGRMYDGSSKTKNGAIIWFKYTLLGVYFKEKKAAYPCLLLQLSQ
jgi:hypothetical protein